MTGYGLSPVECYQYYVALKTHFTGEQYDFTKYGIKGIKKSGFDKRNDKYYFEKISRKWTRREIVPLLVACFLKDPTTYSADLLEHEAKETYLAFIKTRTNMIRTFESEVKDLVKFTEDNNITVKDLFAVKKDGQHPITFRMYLQGLLSIETYVILDNYIKFFKVYEHDKKMKGNYIWEDIHRIKLNNYKPFVTKNFNKEKYFAILKKYMYNK